MSNCLLCENKKANKSGSHIIPAWMISTAFDINGKNRNREIIYNYDNLKHDLPYFGQEVLPEEIENEIGRSLSNEEIEKNKEEGHFLVKDYLFCTECEKRFGTIEQLFKVKVHDKIRDAHFEFTDKDLDIYTTEEKLIVRLFFYSIIWRVSIVNELAIKFERKLEEKLRRILDTSLTLDAKRMRENARQISTEICNIPLMVLRTPVTEKNTEKPVFMHEKYKQPHMTILNDYIVGIYSKASNVKGVKQTFFGLDKFLNYIEEINLNEDEFSIGLLSKNAWKEIKSKYIEFFNKNKIAAEKKFYSGFHEKKFGIKPSEDKVRLFIQIFGNIVHSTKSRNEIFVEAFNECERTYRKNFKH